MCNLDWSRKNFRGKAKKSDMKRLLTQLDEHYKQRDEEFRAGRTVAREAGGEGGEGGEGRKGGEGKGEVVGSDSGGSTEFFISGDGPAKRAVHMPGYPA